MPSHTKIYEFFPKNLGSPDKNKQILRTTFNQYKTYFKNNLFFNVTTISDDLAVFDCKLLDTALTGVFASVHNNGESLVINVQNLRKWKQEEKSGKLDFDLGFFFNHVTDIDVKFIEFTSHSFNIGNIVFSIF